MNINISIYFLIFTLFVDKRYLNELSASTVWCLKALFDEFSFSNIVKTNHDNRFFGAPVNRHRLGLFVTEVRK